MACSHTHMFATCLITCLSIKRYQFTGRDMPLQKSSRVAILVSLQECVFFQPRTVHRETNSEKPQVKLGLRSTSSNAMKFVRGDINIAVSNKCLKVSDKKMPICGKKKRHSAKLRTQTIRVRDIIDKQCHC